jgi:two-component system sensor histidine kinase KdpD
MASSDDSDRAGRPSPDALLEQAHRATRGKMKVFLGAAPGVGKTFEMLRVGQEKAKEGVDVVVGVVETHGRAETAALVPGLEIVPRRSIDYKGCTLDEMDVDAILARRPELVLVDELAHTNAAGSRHPKRYQDVEELLAAGIDVFSTVNVQHLESLNDVVAQITRIRVRETVPDSVLDAADEIEVIDLTPEALIARMKEGKVYRPDQARRALDHYFKPGNLTALRELALRRTAQQVDEQMLDYMRVHAIQGPWAAADRVLVCVSDDPTAPALVRYARRIAERLRAKWTALYVETPRYDALSEAARDRIAECLRLAEELGGEAITISGTRIADEVIGFARSGNVTHIVIGKSGRSRWFELLYGSVVHDLVRKSGTISVHVIAGDPDMQPPAIGAQVATKKARAPVRLGDYLGSTLAVAAAVLLAELIDRIVSLQNLSLVFLTAVLTSAVSYGLMPSLYAAILSALAYNFFFLPPIYTFTIADPANVLSLAFFVIVAFITSNLAGKAQRQTQAMKQRGKTTEELYAFSRKIAAVRLLDDLLWLVAYQLAAMLKLNVVILLPEGDGRLTVRVGYPPEDVLDDADMAAAHWAWANNQITGRGSDTLPGAKRLYLPLQTPRGPIALVGVQRAASDLFTPDERRLLDALLDQAAVAIERVRLAGDVDEVRLQAETERLRNSLLTSISHDLRTPLASIIGAVTSLRGASGQYTAAMRDDLLATIQDESERLNRFVGNLLDMTRLESGGLKPKDDAVDVKDVIGVVLQRTARIMAEHRVAIDLPPDLPLVQADFVLLEQVLFNLLDNAAKYAPVGTEVLLRAYRAGDRLAIELIDEGPGIPQGALESVFDKFTRLEQGDRKRAGTGLGLAIARGFVTAMGGTLTAGNRTDRAGAIFTVTLELAAVEKAMADAAKEAAHGA